MLTGTTVDRYNILKKIGAGGMGEVFLALDTQLDRRVALKVLLTEIAKDENYLRRFKLEAKTVSALNHPNIITIYEIFEADDRLFIVYEYIEGKTLREKIKRNQLSISDSIKITEQIANALAVAHKAGIVHRDIKPENIMIREDGYVKILDFGLAKKRIIEASDEAETIEQIKTREGIIMGSVQYMSPEQARGKETDERTDIWSLGVVLYEMITGKSPFAGETISDSLAAILHAEIEPIQNSVPGISFKLQRIIEKAIKKDLFERYQNIEDFIRDLRIFRETQKDEVSHLRLAESAFNDETIELKNQTTDKNPTLIQETATQRLLAGTQESKAPKVNKIESKKKWKIRKWLLIPAIGLMSLTVFALYISFHSILFPNYYNRYENKNVIELTNDGKSHSAAISPDGKFVAFVRENEDKQSLILKEIQTGNEREIVPAAKVEFLQPTFSPDGKEIYYVTNENSIGTLYRIGVERLERFRYESTKLILDVDSRVTFLSDDYRFAFIRHNTNDDTDTIFITGKYFAFEPQLAKKLTTNETPFKEFTEVSWQRPAKDQFTVIGILDNELMSTAARTYGESSFLEHYSSIYGSGDYQIKNYIWLKDNTRFCLKKSEIIDPTQIQYQVSIFYKGSKNITNDLNDYSSFDVTADGNTIVAAKTNKYSSIWSFTPQTKELKQMTADSEKLFAETGISLMPDGKIIYSRKTDKEVYQMTSHYDENVLVREENIQKPNEIQIFIADEDGSNEKQLTSENEYNFDPVATRDGKYIVFTANYGVWRMSTDGGNLIQLIKNGASVQISPNSKTVIYTSGNNLMKISIDGGEPTALISDSQSSVLNPRISPDGNYIAYSSVQYDRAASKFKELLKIVSFSKEKTDKVVMERDFDSDTIFQWLPDGKSLCFIKKQKTDNIWCFSINDQKEMPLTEFNSGKITNFTLSSDGRKFLIVRSAFKNDLVLIMDSDKISQ